MTQTVESTETPTSRAARKDETQARIMAASMELFATRGYEGTSISQIAAKAGISRGAVFWHFGSKAALFKEACKRFFIPFWREVERSLESLGPRERVLALFDMYEEFTSQNRETIQALVRWVLESPTMRESLRGELLALHAEFTNDLRAAITELSGGDAKEAEVATTALSSILAGNLLFSVIDPGLAQDSGRSTSLRAVAERLLFSFAHPRERVGNA